MNISTCTLRFCQRARGLRLHRSSNQSHTCLVRTIEWYRVIMTGEIGNVQLNSHVKFLTKTKWDDHHSARKTHKTYKNHVGQQVSIVSNPVAPEKIEMSWDSLPTQCPTRQRHAQVMPHPSYRRNTRIPKFCEIMRWAPNFATRTTKNKHKPKHLAAVKYRDSHKTKGKGNHLTRSEPRDFL